MSRQCRFSEKEEEEGNEVGGPRRNQHLLSVEEKPDTRCHKVKCQVTITTHRETMDKGRLSPVLPGWLGEVWRERWRRR